MNNMKKIILNIIILAILGYATYASLFAQEKTFTITAYPFSSENKTEFACSTKMGTTLFPDANLEKNSVEKVTGKLFTNDQTKMAIKINGKTLEMLTATAVEAGTTDPAKLIILRNTKDYIVAVDTQEILMDPGAGTFILNKKTGYAVWTKSKPALLSQNMPDTQAYYMECR
jgi:uncharacterized protein YlzI (FlbEa/FlbD family)